MSRAFSYTANKLDGQGFTVWEYQVSLKATVPVLILPNGSVIEQSLDIMRWSLMRHDPAGWLDNENEDLIKANDGQFKYHLDRAKYADRHGSHSDTHRAACLHLLRPLEDRLRARLESHA